MVHVDGDVGVMVTGGFTTIGTVTELPQPPVYIDEEQFYRATRMRASAPARVALMRLMRENITARSLAKVWLDELEFRNNQFYVRVDRWVPVVAWLLFSSIVLTLGLSFVVSGLGHQQAAICFFLFATLSFAFIVVVLTMHVPFMIAKRLLPMVEEVNAELPEILAEWKKGGMRKNSGIGMPIMDK